MTKQQAIGSLFKLLAFTSVLFLGACAGGQGPITKNVIVHNNHERIESTYHLAWKLYEDIKWELPESSTKLHNNAVMVALRQSHTGQDVKWWDPSNNAHGYSKTLVSYPNSGGYCRTTETVVNYGENRRLWLYDACTSNEGASWTITLKN